LSLTTPVLVRVKSKLLYPQNLPRLDDPRGRQARVLSYKVNSYTQHTCIEPKPLPLSRPPPHDPPNQETGRGRRTKRLRRAADTRKRRERKRKNRHESQCEHNEKVTRQAEAKAAQALEGAKRRAQKKKTKQAEKEKNAKRKRQAQGGRDSTSSRGSDGTGVQRDAEKGGAGCSCSHTAGHRPEQRIRRRLSSSRGLQVTNVLQQCCRP
jgi:hypothetical protein